MNKSILILIALVFITLFSKAQQKDVNAIIEEGAKLSKSGQYLDAIAKFEAALKIDPKNDIWQYQLSYNYFKAGSRKKAIDIMENNLRSSKNYLGKKYALLGTMYEDEGQPKKADESYMAGIKAEPDYDLNYYNLAMLCQSKGEYANAEKWAKESIKRASNNADASLIYMHAVYSQNKFSNAFLAACNFLLIEPDTETSKEVLEILAAAMKQLNKDKADPDVQKAEEQFKYIITAINSQVNKSAPPNDFFKKFYVDYFYSMYQSGHLPVVCKIVLMSINPQAAEQWASDNTAKVQAFRTWVRNNPRKL
ncbi:tetratricopeptide repeat protein [Mucilaginibacter roseus]|uniref:Tetratricopeptide repeat protein n=1 Tax=Mucilaginibacter roseus TaxID=1528868 RepID=A0ABS8U7X1_9SPHI|nr:tetratricopeptide repeat protein [Mucilaginibacter roseus]MCD8742260.1 tetratricopeptide repeat protein [Mucilaginibacter roseus]